MPGEQPGAFVLSSAMALAARGWQTDVLVARPYVPAALSAFAHTMIRGTVDAKRFSPHLNVRTVRYPAAPRISQTRLARWLRARSISRALELLVHETRPDILHVHTEELASAASSVARAHAIPAIATLHGIDSRGSTGASASLRTMDRVVIVGEPLRDHAHAIYQNPDRIDVVQNGVDPPHGARTKPIFTSPELRFVTVSNLHDGKGIDIALVALARWAEHAPADWRFRIAGDGAERKNLEALARRLGIANKVTFVGRIPHADVYRELHQSDIFVLPSYREAFGIAYLEAMAAGLVTIGVRGQGPDSFIDDGVNGFLVEPQSAGSLANIFSSIAATDPGELRKLAQKGQETARRRFSWPVHAEQLEAVFARAIAGYRA